MADFDSKLPIRSLAADNCTEIADSSGATINPAKEDGNLLSVKNAVEIMDDWDDGSDRAKTNLIALNGNTVSVNAGDADDGTQRVVIATDQSSIPFVIDEGNSDIVAFDSEGNVGTNLSDTHTFTPSAACRVKSVQAAASGQMKVEIKWGVTGGETTKLVSFTSKGHLNFEVTFPDGIALTASDSLLIVRTNTDNQTMAVYSSVVYQLD